MVLSISCILISHIPNIIKKIHSEISKMRCNSMHPAEVWTQNLLRRIGFMGRECLMQEMGYSFSWKAKLSGFSVLFPLQILIAL